MHEGWLHGMSKLEYTDAILAYGMSRLEYTDAMLVYAARALISGDGWEEIYLMDQYLIWAKRA